MEESEKTIVDQHQNMIDNEMDKMSKEEEAKKAASDSSSEEKILGTEAEEAQKAEEAKKVEEAKVAQAKEDERILASEENELSEEDKVRRDEITKEEEEKDTGKKKDGRDKRIGKLSGKNKDLQRDLDAAQAENKRLKENQDAIDKRLKALETPAKNEDRITQEKQGEKERIERYLKEDADKPREERRETSKEELEDWNFEDPTAVYEWMFERNRRREREREADRIEADKKRAVGDLVRKQNISAEKVSVKHPELEVEDRFKELKAEGKTASQIHEIIKGENEKYRIAYEVQKDMPELLQKPDGPELVAKEMEKRISEKNKKPKKDDGSETEEEKIDRIKEEAAEAERQRQRDIDEGLESKNAKGKRGDESEFYKQQLAKAKKAGLSKKDLDEMIARRRDIPGAAQADK